MPVLTTHKETSASALKTMEVSPEDATFLQTLLKGELQRSRALVDIYNLRKQQAGSNKGVSDAKRPLLEKLGQYPLEGVDLENIVAYPPKLEPVPVKPLFLDVAWNYVQYPTTQTEKKAAQSVAGGTKEPEAAPKKGWFGFGRG